MIQIPTVLILGAGASRAYGYPSGTELKNLIIERLRNENSEDFKSLCRFINQPRKIPPFREALEYSGLSSVDAFLERRPDHIFVGKVAMAQVLIAYENTQELFIPDKPEEKSGKWYEYLFEMLDAPPKGFPKNQLSVITYNYDRSFEHFLITALKNNYDCGESEAAKIVKSIPIIHLHGNLGDLPFHGSKNERPYRSDVNLDNIKLATENIKIVSEAVKDDPEFQKARYVLSNAKRVIFLGFGYHDDNVFRLDLRQTCQIDVSFYGSCFGFTELERKTLSRWHFDNMNFTSGSPSEDVKTFLRTHVNLKAPAPNFK